MSSHITACEEEEEEKTMAGFITYWPKEQIGKLEKEKDNGPISVIFGSAHTKMPSIKSVKEGDVIYPVTVSGGTLCVLARLPVEKIEPAYEYLIREVGSLCGALVPDEKDWNWREFYKNAPVKPHKCHQRPFNCCSETAAVSAHGSSIELRPLPKEKLSQLMFGPTKAKQKPMMLDKNGSPKVISISSSVRKMSEETQEIFEAMFSENGMTYDKETE